MSNPPGTARWHLEQAGAWLIAARTIFDDQTPMPDKVHSITAMASLSQAHATLAAAINADPSVGAVWGQTE